MSWLNREFPDICSLCVMQLCGGLKNRFVCVHFFTHVHVHTCTYTLYLHVWVTSTKAPQCNRCHLLDKKTMVPSVDGFSLIWFEARARKFGLDAATTETCGDMSAPSPGSLQHTQSFVSMVCATLCLIFWMKPCFLSTQPSVAHLKLKLRSTEPVDSVLLKWLKLLQPCQNHCWVHYVSFKPENQVYFLSQWISQLEMKELDD